MNKYQRLQEALENAKLAFWASIASSYPEITTGDVSPEQDFYFGVHTEAAVREWLETNKTESNDQK